MNERFMKAPFPRFGGKSRVAKLVWEMLRDGRHHRDHHRIPELPVCLRVGDGDDECGASRGIEAHQARAFPRCQALWVPA